MAKSNEMDAPYLNGGGPGQGSGGGNEEPKTPLDKPGEDDSVD